MISFLSRPFGWLRGRASARITCNAALWAAGMRELERRTLDGVRESGAFLLGYDRNGRKEIVEFVYYDDIDPHALDTGIVHFNGNRLPRLWEHCRARGYGVVADVHVHPAGYGQSPSDKTDPVMPRAGHIAFIIPDFVRGATAPGGIGMYEYFGNGSWRDHSASGASFLRLVSSR